MAAIKGKDTKPEMLVRRYLHSRGLRFRLHRKDLPGRPDIVLPRYCTAIFINGCFWHGHWGCRYYRLPKTNVAFWEEKIERNRARDRRNYNLLGEQGWRVLVIWECDLRRAADRARLLESLYQDITRPDAWKHVFIDISPSPAAAPPAIAAEPAPGYGKEE